MLTMSVIPSDAIEMCISAKMWNGENGPYYRDAPVSYMTFDIDENIKQTNKKKKHTHRHKYSEGDGRRAK